MSARCTHLDHVRTEAPRTPADCEECSAAGSRWVHRRLCLECGHVGCCDSSPNRHATKHFQSSYHPVMKSFEPDEDWGYRFVEQLLLEPAPRPLTD